MTVAPCLRNVARSTTLALVQCYAEWRCPVTDELRRGEPMAAPHHWYCVAMVATDFGAWAIKSLDCSTPLLIRDECRFRVDVDSMPHVPSISRLVPPQREGDAQDFDAVRACETTGESQLANATTSKATASHPCRPASPVHLHLLGRPGGQVRICVACANAARPKQRDFLGEISAPGGWAENSHSGMRWRECGACGLRLSESRCIASRP